MKMLLFWHNTFSGKRARKASAHYGVHHSLRCRHSCICGYYYGLKKPAVPAAAQLFEQLSRVGAVFLIYRVACEQGAVLSPLTAVVGLVIGEFASMLFSVFCVSGQSAPPGKSAGSPGAPSPFSLTRQMLAMALPVTGNPTLHESAGQRRIHSAAPMSPAIRPVHEAGAQRLWNPVRHGSVLYPVSQRSDRRSVSHAAALRIRIPGRRGRREPFPARSGKPCPSACRWESVLPSSSCSSGAFSGTFSSEAPWPETSSSPWPGPARFCI